MPTASAASPTAIPQQTVVGDPTRDPTRAVLPYLAAGALAGVVTLVANRDRVLSHGAAGWSDLATRQAMAPDALFWIASMTKPMTGALLALLADEGRLSLDDAVEKHLPEFAGQELAIVDGERTVLSKPSRAITVRDCLAHVSGLPFASRPEAGKIDVLTLREAALSYALTPLTAEPGTRYTYSNAGINTAARVAEVVTGERYADLMAERLLNPLGMRDTTFVPDAAQAARLAKTYKGEKSEPGAAVPPLVEIPTPQLSQPLTDRHRQGSPAGGYLSTAADVGRFGRMVLAGGVFNGRRLMSEEAVRTMTTSQTGLADKSYGLGWSIDATGFNHGGAIATDLRIDTANGLVLVYLVQQAGYVGPDGAAILPAFRTAAAQAWTDSAWDAEA